MQKHFWLLIAILLLSSQGRCEDSPKQDSRPSPILGQNEHHLLEDKKFYVELKESTTDFLILQLIGLPSSGLISAQVFNSKHENPKLVNIVEDDNSIFFASKEDLNKKCEGTGDPCFIEFTLQKLGNTDIKNIQAIAISSKKEGDVNLSDQLPVSFPFSNDLKFNLKYVPSKTSMEDALMRGIDIHIVNKFAPLIITAHLTGDPKKSDGDKKKTYITGDIWTNIIHIPPQDIILFNNPVIKIELEPEDNKNIIIKKEDLKTTKFYWTSVQVGSGTKAIHDKKYIEDFVEYEKFKYYRVKKPKNVDALVILTVLEGESDLYAKKGSKVYPDLNTFDFKSTSIKDDEITFPRVDSSPDEEEITIGVYGSSTSRYRISFYINSTFKVYPVQSGEFIHKFIEKGQSLVLQYDLDYGVDKYIVGFTGEFSQVDALANFYDENTQGFIDSIPDLTKKEVINLGSNLFAGTLSRTSIDRPKDSAKAQLLVRILNPGNSQIVSAFIVPNNPESRVQVKSKEKITDTLARGSEQTYAFYFENSVQEGVLEVELAIGKVKILLTDMDDFKNDPNPLTIEMEAASYSPKREIDLYRQKEKKSMGLFKKFLAKVVASGDSVFSLYSTRKGDSFIPVKTSNDYIIQFDPSNPMSFYYHVSKEVKTLAIQFEAKNPIVNSFGYGSKDEEGKTSEDRKFEAMQDVLNRVDLFYITEEKFGTKDAFKNNRLPANIVKMTPIQESERYYVVYEVNVMEGYLVISPKRNQQGVVDSGDAYIANFKLSINNIVSIGPNYRTTATVDRGKIKTYSLLAPERSTVDITVSACRGGNITVNIFEGHLKNQQKVVTEKVLSSNIEDVKMESTFKHRLVNVGSMKTVFIEIFNPSTNSEGSESFTTFAINTVHTTFDDKISLATFFEKSFDTIALKHSNYGVKVDQTPEDVKFTLDRSIPIEGFTSRYPNAKLITYDYFVIYSNERPKVFDTDNVCDASIYHDRKSFYSVFYSEKARADNNFRVLNYKDGKFYPNFTMISGYPRTDPPYHGVLQIKITIVQQDTSEITTDAVVMLKTPFLISYRPRRPMFYYILVILIILVIGGVAFYLMNAAKTAIKQTAERGRHENIRYSTASDTDRHTGLELN